MIVELLCELVDDGHSSGTVWNIIIRPKCFDEGVLFSQLLQILLSLFFGSNKSKFMY